MVNGHCLQMTAPRENLTTFILFKKKKTKRGQLGRLRRPGFFFFFFGLRIKLLRREIFSILWDGLLAVVRL